MIWNSFARFCLLPWNPCPFGVVESVTTRPGKARLCPAAAAVPPKAGLIASIAGPFPLAMTSTDQPIPFTPAFAFGSGTGMFSSTYFDAAPAEADADAAALAEAAGRDDGDVELVALGPGAHAARSRRATANGASRSLFMSEPGAGDVPRMTKGLQQNPLSGGTRVPPPSGRGLVGRRARARDRAHERDHERREQEEEHDRQQRRKIDRRALGLREDPLEWPHERFGHAIETVDQGLLCVSPEQLEDEAEEQQDLDHREKQRDDARHHPDRVVGHDRPTGRR